MLHTRGWNGIKLRRWSFGKEQQDGEDGLLSNLHKSRYLMKKTETYGEMLGSLTHMKWKCKRKKTQTDAEDWLLQNQSCNNICIQYVLCGDCTVILQGHTSCEIGVSEATMSPVPQK
jgi:hypothetical protein